MELGRRDFLLASLAMLGAGCQQRDRIAGEIQGANDRRGHRLRDSGASLRTRAPSVTRRTEVVIIGGGVAGLSAAWRLLRAGVEDFVILELEDQAGGTARFGENAITPYPWGAHYLPVPSQNLVALCELLRELGVLRGFDAAGRAVCDEAYLCRSPQERIFHKGRWYEGLYLRAGASPDDLRQLEQFHDKVSRWVRARAADGRRAFTLPHRHAAPEAAGAGELDRQTIAQYLDRLELRSPRLRWYVDYACRDDFGLRASAASAWAGMHYYAARLQHPDDSPPEVLTWPEGNGWLVRRLLERVGARVRTGALCLDVRQLPAGSDDRIEVLFEDTRQRGDSVADKDAAGPLEAIQARQAIFALPTFLRREVIADVRAHPPDWLQQFTYAPWLVGNLTVRRAHNLPVSPGRVGDAENLGFPPCWDNVLYDSPSLGYVVATHQREPTLAIERGIPVPRTVWTYYLPFCDGDPRAERTRLLSTSWASFRDLILGDLGRAEPGLAQKLERLDLFRWGHGMLRPLPGLFTSGALTAAAASQGDLHFAHTDLGGMALFEEAHHAGVAAAEAVLDRLNHPYTGWS